VETQKQGTWLEVGDDNIKYFHQFVNFRGNLKIIWEIKNEDRTTNSSFPKTT
jgi:hypothetical protein